MPEAVKPKRIQRKRTKGWRMPENTVYVGRPTKWGNPYRIGDLGKVYLGYDKGYQKIKTVEQALEAYRLLIGHWSENWSEELKGKNLACWCPLNQPCHADILLELANV